MVNFGNDVKCEVVIPNGYIDPETFTIYNRNGLCYIVDRSMTEATRIKAVEGKRYRLFFNDYISLGLD